MTRALLAIALPVALAGCMQAAPQPLPPATPQDAFWQALSSHCGKAFAGELVSEDPADDDFVGAAMVMHVRECTEDRIAVPFHVEWDGKWDRSRTWVITRTDAGLRLKHDHRHEDGKPDAVTLYGGDTAASGTAQAQAFPVDDFSIAMFQREGLTASVTNVWTVAVDPAGTRNASFAYQLKRTVEGGAPAPRLFRVEFDLTQPIPAPPAPWGHE